MQAFRSGRARPSKFPQGRFIPCDRPGCGEVGGASARNARVVVVVVHVIASSFESAAGEGDAVVDEPGRGGHRFRGEEPPLEGESERLARSGGLEKILAHRPGQA